MRLKEYLQEKTNKKEFETSLNNENIKAGCEFEFYLDQYNNLFTSSEPDPHLIRLRDEADQEVIDANKAIDDYHKAMEDLEEEYDANGEKLDEKEDKKSELEDKLSNLKDDQMGLDNSDDEYNDIQDQIDKIKKEIKSIDDEIYDLEEEIRLYDNDDKRMDLEEEYDAIPSTYSLSSYYDLLNELYENGFWYGDIGESDDSFNQQCLNWYEDGEVQDIESFIGFTLEDLFQEMADSGDGFDEDDVRNLIENDLGFPFSIDGWEVKPDESLGDGGVEIITPIEKVGDLVDIIKDVFDWIDDEGYTDNSCGFHVHMSMDTKHEIDPLKLLMFIEEGKIYENFEDRVMNTYAKSIRKGHFDKLEPFTYDNLKTLIKKEKLDKKMNTEKYLGIHLIELEKNHVEFRYMGGKNYHKKFDDVRNIIANYAHWLSIACDPDYKRREYIEKVARLTNYYNYLYIFHYIQVFLKVSNNFPKTEVGTSWNKWKKLLDIEIKPYKQSLKALPKPKVSSKKTATSIKDLAFKKSTDDFKEFLKKRYGYTKKFVIAPF